MPRFSILTITLNNEKGIEKTWNSIKSQSFSDYEWLVQDGASSDNTLSILKKSPADVKSEPDEGIYDAMNRLITRARGDYLIFLNAGDCLASPETLTLINEKTAQNPDFIYGDALEELDQEQRYKTARSHQKLALGMFTHHQAMIYNRKTVDDLQYNTDYKIAADYDFTARFLQSASKVEYIPHPLCIFEAGGVSQTQTKLGRDEQFKIRKRYNLCAPYQNHIIKNLQSLNMAFRTVTPNLYWRLKKHA
jgi:putative colanic acid biosynthesis glycosyltransferase